MLFSIQFVAEVLFSIQFVAEVFIDGMGRRGWGWGWGGVENESIQK